MQLGLHDDLIEAGGNVISRFVGYDEAYSAAEAEASALPLADLVPGVPGALGIGHPVACQALFDAAVRAGRLSVHLSCRVSRLSWSSCMPHLQR